LFIVGTPHSVKKKKQPVCSGFQNTPASKRQIDRDATEAANGRGRRQPPPRN